MTELFLRLIGGRTEEVADVMGASLAFRGLGSLGWVVLAAMVLGVGVWWLHARTLDPMSARTKVWLIGLRIAFLLLLLALFLRPVLSLTVEGNVRRLLPILIDGSASMQITDARIDPADQARAALAKDLIDAAGGLSQPLSERETGLVRQVPRVELVKNVFTNRRLKLLERLEKHFDVAVFSFGDGLAELASSRSVPADGADSPRQAEDQPSAWVDRLEASSQVTALGDALREVLRRKRGQPLAGVVLMTDGVSNSGTPPRDALPIFQSERVPLFAYGVGVTSPRDVAIENLFAPEVVFMQDEAAISARVRSRGLEGQAAEVVLKLGGEVVARAPLTLSGDVEVSVPMRFTPASKGEFDLEAYVQPRPDETVTNNNYRAQRLRVVDARIKVLMVEQAPRWEFRYLQAMLMRDRRVELKCYLVEGDPGIARAPESPYLAGFPARKEELFAYDVVILGDVDPQRLTAVHQENLSEWVSRFGGALIVLAGKRWTPQAYQRGPLERMLPVELDPASIPETSARPISLKLTAAGQGSPMLRLAEDEAVSQTIWGQLPPVYWVARVARAKPAAQVLIVDPDPAKETRFGKMPVMALQQYGLGQVLFMGTDNTWRWRKNVGDAYHTALWGQVAQRLSLQRLLGGSKRTQLSTDRQNYVTGDRVTVYARLYSAGYDPVEEPSVEALLALRDVSGQGVAVVLRPLPEQAGLYRGEFMAPAPGEYQFTVRSDLETHLDLLVAAPQFEFGESAMNEALLRELAAGSSGRFLREEDLHDLPETIRTRTDRVRSYVEVELWSSPLYFLLLLGVVTAEWLLRKKCFLK